MRLEGGAGVRDAAIDDLAQDGDGFGVGLGGGEVDEQIEVFIVLQNFQVGLAAEGDTGDDQRRVAALDEDFERAVAEAAPGVPRGRGRCRGAAPAAGRARGDGPTLQVGVGLIEDAGVVPLAMIAAEDGEGGLVVGDELTSYGIARTYCAGAAVPGRRSSLY